jgi:hypothetical protein
MTSCNTVDGTGRTAGAGAEAAGGDGAWRWQAMGMSSVANIAKAVEIWMVRCDTAGSFPEQRSQDSERLVMLQYTWVVIRGSACWPA